MKAGSSTLSESNRVAGMPASRFAWSDSGWPAILQLMDRVIRPQSAFGRRLKPVIKRAGM